MRKSSVEHALLAAACLAVPSAALATGMYTPPQWLDNGGAAVEHPPEFYWEIEIRKIAGAFKPSQERVPLLIRDGKDGKAAENETLNEQAARLDMVDYQEAVDKGLVKAADAVSQHKAMRDAIAAANETTTAPPPSEPASEFSDYNQGAYAFHLGEKHYDEASRHWEALLKRPAAERHYRSTWAAFMLGKLYVYAKSFEAVKMMRMVRQLAKEGFADSLGLAADSYGWEAKSELDQDHLEKAAQLYLTQLALGDDSAIVSLKALVPDRGSMEGMMNFGPQPPANADEEAMKKFDADQEKTVDARLERAVHDPLLRRLTTAHVLATETVSEGWIYAPGDDAGGKNDAAKKDDRSQRWLAAVEKAKLDNVDDAEQLGWVAYTAGEYAEAERWLKLSSGDSSAALWLKSRLQRRTGNLAEAAKSMVLAWKKIEAEESDDNEGDDEGEGGQFAPWSPGLKPFQSASGDLGSLHLTRGDFVNAYDVFENGNMHDDAAFVAERVLTADELKKYVDEHFPEKGGKEAKPKNDAKDKDAADKREKDAGDAAIRWMLGRRLVREDRYEEARAYLPVEQQPVLDKYVTALKEGANEKLPKARRARAWFEAATIARYSGMELMGYENAPDGFVSEGSFESTDIAAQRETGTVMETKYENDKEITTPRALKIAVPVTAEEKKRLAASTPSPNKRFHYRYVAAALGWKAAALLPDQSDELADVLNASGNWIKKDDKAADKFIQAIERRTSKTPLGKKAGVKHWFVEQYGPWSVEPKE
ncbi:MAG: hypothetical protein JWO94_3877 [Verrucomicrobiaceae bacterium]|nr:hypothetical protein [Verrucomicrobiaceae bacterium]